MAGSRAISGMGPSLVSSKAVPHGGRGGGPILAILAAPDQPGDRGAACAVRSWDGAVRARTSAPGVPLPALRAGVKGDRQSRGVVVERPARPLVYVAEHLIEDLVGA